MSAQTIEAVAAVLVIGGISVAPVVVYKALKDAQR